MLEGRRHRWRQHYREKDCGDHDQIRYRRWHNIPQVEKELVDLRWSPWYRIPDTSFQRQLARCWEHQGRIPWWQERNWSQSGSGD